MKFADAIKEFGYTRLIKSPDTYLSIVILSITVILSSCGYFRIPQEWILYVAQIIAGIFGITIASFSILTALSDRHFLAFLHKKRLLSKILFPFWWVGCVQLFTVILTTVYLLFSKIQVNCELFYYLGLVSEHIVVFLFFYSLFSTFFRISSAINFALYKVKFSEWADENESQT